MPDLDPAVRVAVDRTIRALASKAFSRDPAVPPRLSRAASVIGSAQKRHGHIIELALRNALSGNPALCVWQEAKFYVPTAADHVCNASRTADFSQSALPYLPGTGRRIQLDLVVWRPAASFLSSYEIKRGNGAHDAGKTQQILRNLICTQLVLKGYGERVREVRADVAEAHLVSYYGCGHIPPPWRLTRHDLDEHFAWPVSDAAEAATEYFRIQLERLCLDITGDPTGRQRSLLPEPLL